MKRGEIWAAAGGPNYAGKPRPVVVIQSDRFDATASVTVCAFTGVSNDAPLFRIDVEPGAANGLITKSWLMIDKIATMPRERLDRCIGRLAAGDLSRLDRAMMVFLGLAG